MTRSTDRVEALLRYGLYVPHGRGRCVMSREDEQHIKNVIAAARRYEYLRTRDLDAIGKGGVFAGLTPENMVINLEDLDARIDTEIASQKEKAA
jgi:hypothetical protein